MKRLLLAPLLLTLLVASCSTKKKYNSYREANDACKEWVKEGGTYDITNPKYVVDEGYLKLNPNTSRKLGDVIKEEATYTIPIRWCNKERETNQVLGLRIPERKKGDKRVYTKRCNFWHCSEISPWQKENSKVEANFYY